MTTSHHRPRLELVKKNPADLTDHELETAIEYLRWHNQSHTPIFNDIDHEITVRKQAGEWKQEPNYSSPREFGRAAT